MARIYDVIGIGNAIVDVIFAASDEFLLEHGIAKSVMTLIDEFRAARLVAAGANAQESSGGSAANTMAGLASFGAQGSFIGKVKNDRLGLSFAQGLSRIGVDFDTAMAQAGSSTACCVIAVTPDGHRSMSTYLGACRELTPDDIDPGKIAASSVLYIEGYMWDDPRSKAAIRKAIAAAKRAERRIAFTLSDPFCVGRYRNGIPGVDEGGYRHPVRERRRGQSAVRSGRFEPALQAAREWRGLAALTRSEKGCVVAGPSGIVHVQAAEPVAKALDTTGAGDQFAAGFLYGLIRQRDLQTCARLGAIAAAEVISHYGARPEHSLRALAEKAGL